MAIGKGAQAKIAALAAQATRLHEGILRRGQRDVEDAVQIGNLLDKIKAEMKASGERDFKKFCKSELPFTYQLACMYRRLAKYAKGKKSLPFKTLTDAYIAAGIVKPTGEKQKDTLPEALKVDLSQIPEQIQRSEVSVAVSGTRAEVTVAGQASIYSVLSSLLTEWPKASAMNDALKFNKRLEIIITCD